MERTELAKDATIERMQALLEKFPDLRDGRIDVTLEMRNSPAQAGPDLFTVRTHVVRGRYGGIRLEKSAPNLYSALADVVDHMLERLNRFGDRERVMERNKARRRSNLLTAAQRKA